MRFSRLVYPWTVRGREKAEDKELVQVWGWDLGFGGTGAAPAPLPAPGVGSGGGKRAQPGIPSGIFCIPWDQPRQSLNGDRDRKRDPAVCSWWDLCVPGGICVYPVGFAPASVPAPGMSSDHPCMRTGVGKGVQPCVPNGICSSTSPSSWDGLRTQLHGDMARKRGPAVHSQRDLLQHLSQPLGSAQTVPAWGQGQE